MDRSPNIMVINCEATTAYVHPLLDTDISHCTPKGPDPYIQPEPATIDYSPTQTEIDFRTRFARTLSDNDYSVAQMWTYSSVDLPRERVSRTDRLRIYISECVVCFCIVFFIICVGLLLYLFFHLYNSVATIKKVTETLIES